MSSNFIFLKKVDNNLFNIITEAEKLYRDEYFEQCIVQTRRFGEQICKSMLEQNGKQTGTFDEMLSTLSDFSNGYEQEKEFINDLYFLKKNGNKSAHSSSVKKEGMLALECLKRAFEVAINYSVYNQNGSVDFLKLNFDVELLVTNKKSVSTLTQKYEAAKKKEIQKQKTTNPGFEVKSENKIKTTNKISKIEKNISAAPKLKFELKITLFWKLIIFLSSVSFLLLIFLTLAVLFRKYFQVY